ncbi:MULTISPECIES: hypothetical protein [Corynebacterium]|uniref:hypothetical protein n=1 Tax=Corynebacterium TaxID=1716 RepID=UPI002264B552|nr:hypothetical protein [Corynebacterium sp. Marseille-P8863]
MNRVMVALGAACVLVLSGCSGSGAGPGEAESTTVTSTTSVPEFAAVGDTLPVGCDGGECQGSLEVEEILLGGQCVAGGEADVAEGETLVQVRGVLSAEDGEVRLDAPVVWDKENFKNTGKPVDACEKPSGYEPWSTDASAEEKVRVYGAFAVPEAAVTLGIEGAKFDLAEVEKGGATHASPATQVTESADAPASEASATVVTEQTLPPAEAEPAEPVIGFTEAPGNEAPHVMDKQIASCGDPSIHETGTTFFTDGTSGWTQQCASQMWPVQEAMIAEQEASMDGDVSIGEGVGADVQ